jgi:hypothetical protein
MLLATSQENAQMELSETVAIGTEKQLRPAMMTKVFIWVWNSTLSLTIATTLTLTHQWDIQSMCQ